MGKSRDNRRRYEHHRQKSLESRVRVSIHNEQMQELSREYCCDHEALFCGYLRQPIDVVRSDNSCYVGGGCALDERYCKRVVERNSVGYAADKCDKYVRLFGAPQATAEEVTT